MNHVTIEYNYPTGLQGVELPDTLTYDEAWYKTRDNESGVMARFKFQSPSADTYHDVIGYGRITYRARYEDNDPNAYYYNNIRTVYATSQNADLPYQINKN